MLGEALRLAEQDRDPNLVSRIHWRLGNLSEDFDGAESHYKTALAAAGTDAYLVAGSRINQGYNRIQHNRLDEALPFLTAALEASQKGGAKAYVASAYGNLGWCYFRLGDWDQAMRVLTSAAALNQELGNPDEEQVWVGALGVMHWLKGDFDQAIAFEQRAAKLAQVADDEEWVAIAWNNLAEIYLAKGDLAAAQKYNDQALEVKRRRGNLWSLVYSELNAAKIAVRAGNYQVAESGFQSVIRRAPEADAPDVLWEAYGALAALYRQNRRPAQAEKQYRNAIDTIDREWRRLGSDDWKISFLAPHLIRFFQDYVDFLIERGQPEKALEMAESSRARVLNQQLEKQKEVPAAFDLAKLRQAAAPSRTVILSYWLAPGRSSVWVIRGDGITRIDLAPDKDIAAMVRRYTANILNNTDPLEHADPVTDSLYRAVLAPVRKLIPPGSNIIVAPDGELHQLNFETIVVPDPRPHYWIEDTAISITPSLRALSTGVVRSTQAPRLLLLGDPKLAGPEFQPLPNVKQEVTEVVGQFDSHNRTVFTGDEAVPEKYAEAQPGSFTNIHFATHATATPESPLNSAIILSHKGENFKLYARTVAGIPLKASLVTISACHSAWAKTYSGEGLMGFAWAFLQAGAQNVIASLWDVDDAGAVRIMKRLYAGIAAGEMPAQALQQAKLELMRQGGRYRKPYFWAPLEVFTRTIPSLHGKVLDAEVSRTLPWQHGRRTE